jgi:hypothetical protein
MPCTLPTITISGRYWHSRACKEGRVCWRRRGISGADL